MSIPRFRYMRSPKAHCWLLGFLQAAGGSRGPPGVPPVEQLLLPPGSPLNGTTEGINGGTSYLRDSSSGAHAWDRSHLVLLFC